ncbi:MAG: GNAT family N-acetyltransferase [Bacteroidetes bacterium]|nr:GNAT family N-acetyltransferase [Bacteroidota bacterium]MBU1116908.1 GNAT family N-acetyltransferase [Bacteroidota bacterium]MBU1797414.1 GNAT family N-acetyltransferase [Bacteroidota bacterium]
MEIVKTTIDKIIEYRTNYLNSLPEFQELFIELMINDSDYYILITDNKEIGYTITNNERVLIEFHVFEKYLPDSHDFFKQVLEDLSITDIYCKSFDSLLLSNCLLSSLPYSVIGVLYREYVESLVSLDLAIKMKKADFTSVGLLLRQDDSIKELFETEQQLIGFIQNENVFEFYKNDEFIGCGMIIRTNSNWNFCDLGVWVKPSKRGNSFGSQIIMNLREFAISENMIPSCGCAIDNIASQKIIEKSGFVSKYKMINFKTK